MSKIRFKKVMIKGFTKSGRLQDLEKKKAHLSKEGWVFMKYKEDGILKSYAMFKKDFPIEGEFKKLETKEGEVFQASTGDWIL